jgi:hypothetical protein
LERKYVTPLHFGAWWGRVAWQSTSEGGNSYPQSVMGPSHGRLRPRRSTPKNSPRLIAKPVSTRTLWLPTLIVA